MLERQTYMKKDFKIDIDLNLITIPENAGSLSHGEFPSHAGSAIDGSAFAGSAIAGSAIAGSTISGSAIAGSAIAGSPNKCWLRENQLE